MTVVEEIVGRFGGASNTTLLGRAGGRLVVYKPVAGSRPLDDFDTTTLAAREVLAAGLAAALGLGELVPGTVLGDGPLGPGAVQDYVEPDPGFDPIGLVRTGHPTLWPVALLDVVANNADRKAGHLLRDARSGGLRAIDHGLTFHPRPKLRTVLWAFAGHPLPPPMTAALRRLAAGLPAVLDRVEALLGDAEARALESRVADLVDRPFHPLPPTDRPALPWPPV